MMNHPMNLKVVNASIGDLSVIRSLYVEAAKWQASLGVTHWPFDGFNEKTMMTDVDADVVYLLQEQEATVGMVILYPAAQPFDQQVWGESSSQSAAYLHRFIIRRTYAGLKLGAFILDWCEGMTRSLNREWLRLDCIADNVRLNQYYRDVGFTYRGEADLKGMHFSRYEKKMES